MARGGNGYQFSGGYGTKGCYAYKGGSYDNMAFYGTGGTEDEMKVALVSNGKYRPSGHDCKEKGMKALKRYLGYWII